jgi:hypothetical protein
MRLFGTKQPRTFSPHDFAVAGHVVDRIPEPKRLGLTHSPRVITTYPDNHESIQPNDVHAALVKLKKETAKKLG